jgi:hypothetical protein
VSRSLCISASENDAKSVQEPVKEQRQSNEARIQATSVEAQDIKALGAEVARLQIRLRYEPFRADAYPEMIQVAESKFKIAIRKKLGAKWS